jgi:hypothetical protein
MPNLLRTDEIGRIEVLDLGRDLAWVGVGVELGNPVHPGPARDKAVPEGLLADAIGGNDADARDDHAPSISHETVCPLNH